MTSMTIPVVSNLWIFMAIVFMLLLGGLAFS